MSFGLSAAAIGAIAAGTTAAVAVGSAVDNSNRADYAGRLQQQNIDDANGVAQGQAGISRADQAPWRAAGENALRQIQTQINDPAWQKFDNSNMLTDPGYQFRLNEGNKALERRQLAGGKFFGGAGLKDVSRFNQDFASNEYGNAFNRFQTDRQNRLNPLLAMAGLGQSSAAQTGNQAIQTGQYVGNNMIQNGQVGASGVVAQGNAMTTGLNSLYGIYRNYQNQNQPVNNFAYGRPGYQADAFAPINDGGAAGGWSLG